MRKHWWVNVLFLIFLKIVEVILDKFSPGSTMRQREREKNIME